MSSTATEQFRVVVVGSGPAGIGVAVELARRGVGPVLMLERWNRPGGLPAKYRTGAGGPRTYAVFSRGRVLHGEQFADRLLRQLATTDVELRLESTVIRVDPAAKRLAVVSPRRGWHEIDAEAVVFATGAREESPCEQGWIAGTRTNWILQTMQLLELASRGRALNWQSPVVAGSNLIGDATAAKLLASGARQVQMINRSGKPRTPLPVRWYFRRWGHLPWRQADTLALESDGDGRQRVRLTDGQTIDCDQLVVSGDLVPNSELLVEAGIATRSSSNRPQVDRHAGLSASGCFATGAVLGGLHGGAWCYQNGRRTGKAVWRRLEK